MSCCKCLFISASDFVGRVPDISSVDNRVLTPSIELTQIQYIKPILCEDLYDELCEQINSDTLTDANYDLLCYIKDVHVRYAFADFIYKHSVKVTKESVVRKVSDESEFVDFEVISRQANQYRLDAQTYADLLVKFLQQNESDYPLWRESDCNKCKLNTPKIGGFF